MAVAPSRAIAPVAVQFADHTRHHIAIRLLPFLFLLYIVNFVDRTNLAYAALGMSRELGFSDRVFGFAVAIFFVSYVSFQIPGALLVERWSARGVISASMVSWGLLTTLTAFVRTPTQLYSARFILGAAESAFFPGVIVYLSHWFVREDRAKAIANFMAAIPLSFVIGSPIAGWLLGQAWLGFFGWRWLFIVEGLPAVLLGIVAFFFLTDWPHQATWLSAEQHQWLEKKLQEERAVGKQKIAFWQMLQNPLIIRLASAMFLSNIVLYSFVFWFPTMLKRQSGLSDLRVGLLGAVPFAVAFVAMQANGWHSDKSRERRWHSSIPNFVVAFGMLGVLKQPQPVPISILLFTAVALGYAFEGPFWSMPTELLSQSAAAAAVGLVAAVGNVAGFVGPYAFGYLHTWTGSFSYGLAGMAVAALLAGMLLLNIPKCSAR